MRLPIRDTPRSSSVRMSKFFATSRLFKRGQRSDGETCSEDSVPFEQTKHESTPRDQTQYSASEHYSETNSGKPRSGLNDADDNGNSDPGDPVEIVGYIGAGEFHTPLV